MRDLYSNLGMDDEAWLEYLKFAAIIMAGLEAGCE